MSVLGLKKHGWDDLGFSTFESSKFLTKQTGVLLNPYRTVTVNLPSKSVMFEES